MDMNKTHRNPNNLINEKSPYLLQHAYNPVNWYPWGEAAFNKAEEEDKPVFLSIGYSTCHWCHVMEKECFEDDEVAEALNKYFVSIKVDREERPDIDQIYMTVCQAFTGRGGWPLTVFMTPDKKPFFAGTYFPKRGGFGVQGFLPLLEAIRLEWAGKRQDLSDISDKVLAAIRKSDHYVKQELQANLAEEAFSRLATEFDRTYGGFGSAPKFPAPHNLLFLLRYWSITKEKHALEMVEKTLDSMYCGGIYDHIGFGFSRYSTDRKWLAPHFEKMLYDNALLAIAYLEAYQATRKPMYAEIARQIFTYVLRDMTSEEGGFYSAEDADSEGEEGKFYTWTVPEVLGVLGEEEGNRFCTHFDISSPGNFEGKSIPNLIKTGPDKADPEFIGGSIKKLFAAREKRIHPYKDDKILTSWNGLMIAALAIGGRVTGNHESTLAAERAVSFILDKLIRADGRLMARYRLGEAAYPGYLEDYAFLIWGLIELYETTYKPEYLEKALGLNEDLFHYFWDAENGGFFLYGTDGEQLITRPKYIYDAAAPSGNSAAAVNLLRLARLTGDFELEKRAKEVLKAFGSSIQSYPQGHSYSLIALMFMQSESREVIIVDPESDKSESQRMIDIINEQFRPFVTTLLYKNEKTRIEKVAPFINGYDSMNGKTTAYICQKHSCQAPVTDIELFQKMLQD